MQELPQLYQSRVGYFDACLKGTIRHEVNTSSRVLSLLCGVCLSGIILQAEFEDPSLAVQRGSAEQ